MSDLSWLINFEALDMQRTCRTCLSQDPDSKNLFVVEHDIQLANILRSVATIKVTENDNLPPNVCKTCADKLMKIQVFKQTCEEIDAQLQQYFGVQERHNMEGQTSISDKMHILNKNMLISIPEAIANMKVENEQSEMEIGEPMLTEVMDIKSEDMQISQVTNENVGTSCSICCAKFKTQLGLSSHLKTHNDGKYNYHICGNKFFTKNGSACCGTSCRQKQKVYRCTKCNMHFKRHYNYIKHHKEQHQKECTMKKIKVEDNWQINDTKEEHLEKSEDKCSAPSTISRKKKQHICKVCDKTYYSLPGLYRHERVHTGERPYLCTICDKRFIMNTDLHAHLLYHEGVRPHVCKVCGKGYTKRYFLDQHEQTHARQSQLKCRFCATVCHSLDELYEHLQHHEKEQENAEKTVCSEGNNGKTDIKTIKFPCSVCGTTFRSRRGLREHTWKEHEADSCNFQCHLCQKTFNVLIGLNTHLSLVHADEKPFLCTECDMSFKSKADLNSHLRKHSHLKPYKCELCPQAFRVREYLRNHVRSKHSDEPIISTCKICGKTYNTKGGYLAHIRTHQPEYQAKRHMCHVCGKGFSLGSILNVHMQTHLEANIPCPMCPKVFRSKIHLRRHLPTHTGEKTVICPICGKAISSQGKMKIHMRVHTGERPYDCNFCGKGFATSTMLKVHMQTHMRVGIKQDYGYETICDK